MSSTQDPKHRLVPDLVVDGRYRLVARVGSGGMADVWLAEDQQLGRNVALKLLHRRFAEDAQFVERFRREASHAAGLQHPNVVSVYDRGTWDGTSYIAMEYVEGPTLKEVVRERGALDPGLAADVIVQVLRAARYAHKRGIVHRDLKPHNVILDEEGRVKVTDFGIARAGASEMTETGAILGTAQYLSPEQAQGLAVDARSDLYAVGVMLYELLTGRLPFDAESAVTIALKHVSEPPLPPAELNPAVPVAMEAVVLRALAKAPEDRFPDADAFIAALQAARDAPQSAPAFGVPVRETVIEEQRRPRWPWIVAALALIALAMLAWLLLVPPTKTVPDVVGARSAEASRILQNRGFEVDIQAVVNPDVPKDRVATQSPQPGEKAREGSQVTITVSAGPGEVAVPAVVGLPRDQAVRALTDAGLEADVERQFSSDVPAGRVISAAPGEGTTVDRGTRVRLVVSRGAEPIEVPDVVGDDAGDATARLEGLGLAVKRVEEPSDKRPGTVTGQDPKAGAEARRGDTVTLTVAQAVEVPDVTGLDVDEATAQLDAAGFEVRVRDTVTTNAGDDGVVLAQSPDAGEERRRGSTVTIRVGSYAGDTPTPDATPEPTVSPEPSVTAVP
jgi:beta-lactam-binding protein with PASTA domain/predicted Ser/Thr protein kinase